MRLSSYLLLLLTLSLCYISCGEDEGVDIDFDAEIQSYLTAQGLTAQQSPSGLYYIIDNPGNNEKPSTSSTIIAHFVGSFLSGNVFQSTYDFGSPLINPMDDLIDGFKEGIQLFGKGGTGTLILPPQLAFGSSGIAGIPPNSVLIFEIELLDWYDDADVYNDQLLTNYIEENDLAAQKTESGMYYIIDVPGTDPYPDENSSVTVDYHGYLLDGRVFDSTLNSGMPVTFNLNGVISGWQEGLQLFGTGGKGTLLIPSRLAYGSAGASELIGRDTPLIFEIELISVQ